MVTGLRMTGYLLEFGPSVGLLKPMMEFGVILVSADNEIPADVYGLVAIHVMNYLRIGMAASEAFQRSSKCLFGQDHVLVLPFTRRYNDAHVAV